MPGSQKNKTKHIFVLKDDGWNPWIDEGAPWGREEGDSEIASDRHLPPIPLEQLHLDLFYIVMIEKGIH